jgi:DNA-binding transcriptional ArsR family regulator
VVEHPVRLEILDRLDGEPLTLSRLSTGIGKDEQRVAYHVQVLESSGLVAETSDAEEGQSLYVTRLKHQPCWITRAVNTRRQRNREQG